MENIKLFLQSVTSYQGIIVLGVVALICMMLYRMNKHRNKLTTRDVVAIGIGAALYATTSVFSISIAPNTSMRVAIALLTVFGALFGPIVGFLIGFIGHALNDAMMYGNVWWSWVFMSGFIGLFGGMLVGRKGFDIRKGKLEKKYIKWLYIYALCGMAMGSFFSYMGDVFLYGEPAGKVWFQIVVGNTTNLLVTVGIGIPVVIALAKMKRKGALLEEAQVEHEQRVMQSCELGAEQEHKSIEGYKCIQEDKTVPNPIISLKNFSFQYDNLKYPTLKNINLQIGAGEKVLIAGPSGSGKSTLAHCINGLIPFAYQGELEGELQVGHEGEKGRSLDEMSKRIGTILQDSDGQFVALTIGEDVAFADENNNMPKDTMTKKVNTILAQMGMDTFEGYSPQDLSGGQKQKVAMAGVLAMEAPILLFDEPLANLDPMSGMRAMQTINELHSQEGKTIIIVEHRIEDVLAHDFDRLVLVDAGRIVFNGSPNDALCSGLLGQYGLREPLYIEAVKKLGVDVSKEKQLTNIQTLKPYKEKIQQVLTAMPQEEAKDEKHKILLQAEDLYYRYHKEQKWILEKVNFTVKEGEFLAILGNNGAGKSTLLKALTGFVKVNQGKITFDNQDITQTSIKARSQMIGYVMQNPNHMITQYMIYDEIAFGLRNFGYSESEVKQRVEEVLHICNLEKYREWPVSALSYGQKKRVTIASILALRPRMIVLDEPTAGQDHRNYTEFMSFLEKLKGEGITVVMITHDMQLALEYADRAVVLSGGKTLIEEDIYTVLSSRAILKQADLRQTSVTTLAETLDIYDTKAFLKQVMEYQRKEICHD